MSFSPNFVGSAAKGSVTALQSTYMNGEIFTLSQAQPVCVNSSGQMIHVDVTSDIAVSGIIGVIATPGGVPTGASGLVMDVGRLENITTAFNIGDAIYINTDGTLMNVRPDIGVQLFVSGCYVVFVGVIVKNQFNNTQKDLKVYMDVVGQL